MGSWSQSWELQLKKKNLSVQKPKEDNIQPKVTLPQIQKERSKWKNQIQRRFSYIYSESPIPLKSNSL